MNARFRYRLLTCLVCSLAAAAICRASRPPISSDGYFFDLLIKIRAEVFPPKSLEQSAVAVVALDRRSLKSEELTAYPRVMLAPVWAKVTDALFRAGAREVGFDQIFDYDANRFPGIAPDYNQSFLAALARERGHVVLGRSRNTPPALPFVAAAGYDSPGMIEIRADPDGRYRHVLAGFNSSTGFVPSLAGLLVTHTPGAPPMPAEVLLAPRQHLEAIPTYSVVDVLRCANDPAAMAAAFKGKIVLIGGTLPEEDRKQSSGRFLTPVSHDATPIAGCGLARLGASVPDSETVPGVFLHAAAVDAVIGGHITRTASTMLISLVAALTGLTGAVLGFLLTPWWAVGAVAIAAFALLAAAIGMLQANYWLPVAIPLYALAVAPAVSYVMRYIVEERTRRRIASAFGHYLSPLIVDKLASGATALRLGGENRELSIMFADLSGFTALSTRVDPETLTAKVNQYLGYVVDQVEESDGYVDKFIGDSVMAIWGAPADDRNHAVSAVRAAMATVERVKRAKLDDDAHGKPGFSIKIGINSGAAVVGNVGTMNRYNYTAVGETVNLASRLEGIPPLYGCKIVVGERTEELARDVILMREIDQVLLKGAGKPLTIYEPIAELSHASDAQKLHVERFSDGLAAYRARRFAEADAIWTELAAAESALSTENSGSKPAAPTAPAVMAERARKLAATPPPADWQPVNVFTTK